MDNQKKQKHISRCRFSFPHYENGKIEHQCLFEGYEDDEIHTCTEEECEQCKKYDSRYIEYPLTIKGIENRPIEKCGFGHTVGCLIAVRPCGEEFGMCAPMDNEAYCVIGNNSAKNCAALIADPEYLQEIAEMIGTDYYIVPLGIEGFVVVPEAYCDVDMQKDALKRTNEASKKDKLFLSKDLYFYGSETGELSVVQ